MQSKSEINSLLRGLSSTIIRTQNKIEYIFTLNEYILIVILKDCLEYKLLIEQ